MFELIANETAQLVANCDQLARLKLSPVPPRALIQMATGSGKTVTAVSNFKFSEVHIVQRLQGNQIDTTAPVSASTPSSACIPCSRAATSFPTSTPKVVVGFCRAARTQ